MIEIFFGKRVHAMRAAPGVEHIGGEHRVGERPHVDAALGEHDPVELDVLRDLQHARRFEQGLQSGEDVLRRKLALDKPRAGEKIGVAIDMAERNIGRLAGAEPERKADKLRLHRIDGGRFRIDRHDAFFEGARDPAVEQAPCRGSPHRPCGRWPRLSPARYGRRRAPRASARPPASAPLSPRAAARAPPRRCACASPPVP